MARKRSKPKSARPAAKTRRLPKGRAGAHRQVVGRGLRRSQYRDLTVEEVAKV